MSFKKKFLLIVIFIINTFLFASCSTPSSNDIVTYNERSGANELIFPAEISIKNQETIEEKVEKKDTVNIFKSNKELRGAIFQNPKGIILDNSGNIYVVDKDLDKVLKFSNKGDLLNEWGSPGSENDGFKEPMYITSDNKQNILISDTWNNRIKIYNKNGKLINIIKESLFGPRGIKIYQDKIYLADTGNHTIKVFTMNGKLEKSIGKPGNQISDLNEPTELTLDDNGNLYIADTKNNRIAKFDKTGKFLLDWKVEKWINPEISKDCWMLFHNNKIYLSNLENKSIDVFDTNGKWINRLAHDIDAPSGIAIYKDNLYFLDAGKYTLHKQKI